MDKKKLRRVLSIQSHVVSGYVGNKSATFPLQLLGFEVDAINTVQFSNHTGYGFWEGQVMKAEDLTKLMDGLTHNQLDRYSHILTGYMIEANLLQRVAQVVKDLRKINPNLVYVCDPVMGDNGKMYVPTELLDVYKNVVLPLATIATPNQFELELLVDRPVTTVKEALSAMQIVHDMGVQTVVLSSSKLGDDEILVALASSNRGGKKQALQIEIPQLPASFTGTGDLFAALFLAWLDKSQDLQTALENTVATLQAVLKRTFQQARRTSIVDNVTVAALELKLIESKVDIETPASSIVAEPVTE